MSSYLTDRPLDVALLRGRVTSSHCGALVTFEGVVRDHDSGRTVEAIDYEAYATMAEREIGDLLREASKRWPEARVMAQHRTGHLRVGEVSVVVVAAAPHRDEAFSAARFMIDTIKERAPIWKKELGAFGERWQGADYAKSAG